jgi:hypothetical protein
MENQTSLTTEQPILIITGMHRSGTSLVTAWLQSAGLDVGQNLLKANYSNPKGFFENTDFLEFHRRILSAVGLEPRGWTVEDKIGVPDEYIHQAKQLIADNASTLKPWGWKEPRTTLFLDFWSKLLPKAKFLFIYRAPWEVADSLYRRGDKVFYPSPELALDIWSAYNQKILDFYSQNPKNCLLVNLNSIVQNSDNLMKKIQEKLSIPLNLPDSQVYDQSLLKTQVSESVYPYIIKEFFPKSFNLYHHLNQIADLREDDNVTLDPLLISHQFLRHWVDMRYQEREIKKEVNEAQHMIRDLQNELLQTQENLIHSRNQVAQLEAEIAEMRLLQRGI